ncbi:phospholipid carrier-dependent glycosyltransferase [Modestobacter roseus]|uniref:phospholipid carrier-dependent glycosyltransferase n=1 Tax=Modestobacter roseus TaxID=1181884 RepID=UPI0034DE30B8
MLLAAPAAEQSPAGGASGRRPLWVWALPLTLLLLGAALRFWALGDPGRLYFDEKYYAQDARDYVTRGVEEGRPAHPPLGKWVIALGIQVFGWTPFGWRVGVALAGSLTVLLTYLTGRRLFRHPAWAALAALLVALDGLALTSSRIAMLDAVLALFVVLAVWLVLVDRDAHRAGGGAGEPLRSSFMGSRYRWLAGLALGLAVATKWSGLLAIGAAALLVLGTELAGRREGIGRATRRGLAVTAGGVLAFLLVPAAVYVASFTGWFVNYADSHAGVQACEAGECDTSFGQRVDTWVDTQVDLVGFHQRLEATHPYRSDPQGWPWLERPVLVYLERCLSPEDVDEGCAVPAGTDARIVMLGSPALWWPALLAAPVLLWRSVVRRDGAAATIGVTLLALWLPWFAAGKPGYSFYLVPAVPFLALALVRAVQVSRWPRLLGGGVLALNLAAFVFFAPIWLGLPLTPDSLDLRYWLDSWR